MLLNKIKTAEALGGISQRSIYNLVKRGDLIGIRIGRRLMFDLSDIEDFIDRQRPIRKRERKPEVAKGWVEYE